MQSAEPPLRTPHAAALRGPVRVFGALGLALAAALALLARGLADGAAAAAPVLGFALAGGLVLCAFVRGWTPARVGPANAVTLLRLALVSLFLAPAVAPALTLGASGWTLFALAVLTLALDGIDGLLARRSGLACPWGARFDMEVDALFGLILSVIAWRSGAAGPWVILLGAMRYGFLAVGTALPWLAAPLPERWRRKAICVVQIGTLAVLLAPALAPPWSSAVALVALGLLLWSFAIDILWLARRA